MDTDLDDMWGAQVEEVAVRQARRSAFKAKRQAARLRKMRELLTGDTSWAPKLEVSRGA